MRIERRKAETRGLYSELKRLLDEIDELTPRGSTDKINILLTNVIRHFSVMVKTLDRNPEKWKDVYLFSLRLDYRSANARYCLSSIRDMAKALSSQ